MAGSTTGLKKSAGKNTAIRKNALVFKKGHANLNLPIEVKTLEGENYVYISIPAHSEVYKVDGKLLTPVTDIKDAEAAKKDFDAAVGTASRGRKGSETDPRIVAAEKKVRDIIKDLPGYKVVTGSDGFPKLAKMRTKKTSLG